MFEEEMKSEHLVESEKSLLNEYMIGYYSYYDKICKDCIKKGDYIKKNCGIIRGFSMPSCDNMERAIKQRKAYIQAKNKVLSEFDIQLDDNVTEVKDEKI